MNINLSKYRCSLILLGLLFLCVSILFYPVLFQGYTFGSPDSLNPEAIGIALKGLQHQSGEFPLWQPWVFSGMPTAEAFTNLSKLYFPDYLFKLFFLSGMTIQILYFIFAGLGCFYLLRYLKASWWSSLLVAIGFAFTPYMVTMLVFGHGSQLMTAAFIPWALLFTMKIWDHPTALNAGWLALILGFQLQRAHAQIAYYTWMLIGAYILMRLITDLSQPEQRKRVGKATLLFALAGGLGIGIALLVYLPSIQYAPYSVRGAEAGSVAYTYATGWSFHPKEMLTFLIPSAFGFGGQAYWGYMPFTDYPNYMGIIILALAVIGLVQKRGILSWFFLATSILALLVSFGKYFSPVYDLFYYLLPYFSKFRVPQMILILLQFNVAVLSAFGLDAILKMDKETIPRWLMALGGITGLSMLTLTLGGGALESFVKSRFPFSQGQDLNMTRAINALRWDLWYQDAWISTLLLVAISILIWLWFKNRIQKKVFTALILVLAILDIGQVDMRIIQPQRGSGRASQLIPAKTVKRYFEKDDVIRFLTADSTTFRIYPAGYLFGESRFAAFNLESIGGYHPAKLKLYNDFLKNTRNAGLLPVLRMMNVKYVIAPQPINHPELKQVQNGSLKTGRGNLPVTVYELTPTLPRAWFVEEVKILGKTEMVWQSLNQASFNPAEVAYLVEPLTVPDTLTRGDVLNIDRNVHTISIQTRSEGEGFLVVSEVYYPLRWKAFLDGEPVHVFQTNGILLGVLIPAGEHTLEFRYDRSAFLKGVTVSFASFGVSLLFILGGYFLQRKRK
jgi:hypothetical protein